MIKKILTLIIVGFLFIANTNAQEKIKYSDLEGKKWKLTIDIKDEIEESLDDDDTFLERIIVKSISGIVDNVLDEIDIYFEFREDSELKITVYAFGEREVEYTKWSIDKRGALIIEDTDSFKSSNDSKWYKVDDIIVAYDEDDRKLKDANIYLVEMGK